MTEAILQEIRKSHCAHELKDKGHNCAGSCKITPKGIELECFICGNEKRDRLPYRTEPMFRRARLICNTLGLNFDDLNYDAQDRFLVEIFRDYCPGCKATHFLTTDYINCPCGYNYSNYKGWTKHSPDNQVKP